MPTAEEIREALENCSEDRCDEECACYMEDDCRLNHLSREEARVVFGKSSGSNLISRQAVMNYLREQQAAVIIEKAKQNMITYDACKGMESSIEAFMNFINQVPADCGAEKVIAKEPNQVNNTTVNSTRNVLNRSRKLDRGSQMSEKGECPLSSKYSIAHLLKNMKNTKFSMLFLLASWVIFFATKKSIAGSVLLILSALYLLCDITVRIRKRCKDAKR